MRVKTTASGQTAKEAVKNDESDFYGWPYSRIQQNELFGANI
jgi:hypothetical protein